MLIVLGGLPGAGKTTIARELARAVGAMHIRIDSIDRIVIADSVNPWPITRDAWIAVAARAGSGPSKSNWYVRTARCIAACLPMIPPAGAPLPPPPPPGPAPNGAPQCPSMLAPGNMSGRKITIARFATTLSLFLSRAIVDRTNLSGEFDLDLRWLPDQPPPVDVRQAPTDATAPPLFTALQEQLGLKLESSRGPVDVLVIDAAEKPTQD